MEHLLAACLDGIRQAYGERAGRMRLEWNRVMLFVWPVVEIPLDELDAVVRRLAPHTEGLGIEQVVVQGRLAGRRRRAGRDGDAPRLRDRARA